MVCMASSWSELPGSQTILSQDDRTIKVKGGYITELEDGCDKNYKSGIDISKEFTDIDKAVVEREISPMRPRSFSDVSFSSGKFRHRQFNINHAKLKRKTEQDTKLKKESEDESKKETGIISKKQAETEFGRQNDSDFERKKSMKVVICRESQVVKDTARGKKVSPNKNQESGNRPHQLLSRSKSAHGRTNCSNASEDEDIPPPKPALPEKYRTSYFLQQIQNLSQTYSALERLGRHGQPLRSDLPNVEKDLLADDHKSGTSAATHQTSGSVNKPDLQGSCLLADENKSETSAAPHQTFGSGSQPDLQGSCETEAGAFQPSDSMMKNIKTDKDIGNVSVKSSNVPGRGRKPFRSDSKIALFRSFDANLRALALKRELDTLRSSEHVKQRLSSSEQQDVADLRKELDNIRKSRSDGSKVPPTENFNLDTDTSNSSSARSKTAGARNFAQNTGAFKPHVAHNKDGAKTLLEESKPDRLDRKRNQGASVALENKFSSSSHLKTGSDISEFIRRDIPLSGTSKDRYDYKSDKSLNIICKPVETEGKQGKNSLQRSYSRSKSESSLVRNYLDSEMVPKKNDFNQSQAKDKYSTTRDSTLNKSVSHISNRGKYNTQQERSAPQIKRKQDTIRKFNYDSFAQVRQKIKANYQRKPDRSESESPHYASTSGVGTGGPSNPEASDDGMSIGDSTSISDNRSDEEKYAALSRSKILHNKSSSLDSHLESNNEHQQHKKTVHSILKLASSASLTDYRSSPIDTTILLDSTSSSSDSIDVYLTENKGVKHEKFNTDIPALPKKRLKPKALGLQSLSGKTVQGGEKSTQQKVVLRQCRIGSDVAFSLVGLNKSEPKPNGNGFLDGQGLVTLRMIPDDQGRFGFNVKGGADQGMPIIVSRVAPNTPADNCIPRLNEGDQVLFINGRDVSQHTHEQVVMFIRASRETHSGELILKIRPNVYSGDDNMDEPDLVYDPDTHQISSASGANALEVSLKVLEESLDSGAALAQFEQLYRKKPGMTMNAARLENNIPKNRYRDISPYDQTRVMIKNSNSGDYINANYVNMEIPVSGIVNRYIAAQGPLPTTCTDFWQMVWEQQSTLVVMLTTKVERGRIKCHQYWPDNYETSDFGTLQITCVKEEESTSFAFREFNLTNVETNEERHISHMQYIAWPDHGVPDDPADFLEFVVKVRQKRVGIVEPVIVHCSAGIGRTGVLITMETAMGLIEANQPVYPLSIVRQMRDQRAMLIQTPSQYKFVCEAIIRSYNEGIVKALPEYQR